MASMRPMCGLSVTYPILQRGQFPFGTLVVVSAKGESVPKIHFTAPTHDGEGVRLRDDGLHGDDVLLRVVEPLVFGRLGAELLRRRRSVFLVRLRALVVHLVVHVVDARRAWADARRA